MKKPVKKKNLKNIPKKIVVKTVFDAGCLGGDYSDMELWFDGVLVERFGDYYHNKGDDTLGGFLQGISWALGKLPEPTYEDVELPEDGICEDDNEDE